MICPPFWMGRSLPCVWDCLWDWWCTLTRRIKVSRHFHDWKVRTSVVQNCGMLFFYFENVQYESTWSNLFTSATQNHWKRKYVVLVLSDGDLSDPTLLQPNTRQTPSHSKGWTYHSWPSFVWVSLLGNAQTSRPFKRHGIFMTLLNHLGDSDNDLSC